VHIKEIKNYKHSAEYWTIWRENHL